MANKDKSENWNYHPDLPLVDPSIFNSPTNPKLLVFWFSKDWFTLSKRVLMVILAVTLWLKVYPSLESAETWAFGWIAQTWVANMILVFCVAGGNGFYMKKARRRNSNSAIVI